MKPIGPVLGVGAIVVRGCKEGKLKVLLVKRRYPPFSGYWSFPGGHVEPGESVLKAAARELEEETGLKADPRGVVHVHELIARGHDGRLYHYVILDVLFDYVGGEPRAASDAAEARFIPVDEALKLPLTPGARYLLSRLGELVESGCSIEVSRSVEEA